MCGIYLFGLTALAILVAWSVVRRGWGQIYFSVRVIPPQVELDVRKDE